MNCEGACGLELPDRLIFKCDGHCEKKLCIHCIKKHAVDVTMTHRVIPEMARSNK